MGPRHRPMGRQGVEGLVNATWNLLTTGSRGNGDHLPRESDHETRSGRGGRPIVGRTARLLPRDGDAAGADWRAASRWIHPLASWPAWLLETTTRTATKSLHAFVDGEPVAGLTQDTILDNIALYWLTGTAASAARSYWDSRDDRRLRAASLLPPVSVPVGSRRSPARSGLRAAAGRGGLPDLASLQRQADRGGHFAAWEEPELFAAGVAGRIHSLR